MNILLVALSFKFISELLRMSKHLFRNGTSKFSNIVNKIPARFINVLLIEYWFTQCLKIKLHRCQTITSCLMSLTNSLNLFGFQLLAQLRSVISNQFDIKEIREYEFYFLQEFIFLIWKLFLSQHFQKITKVKCRIVSNPSKALIGI